MSSYPIEAVLSATDRGFTSTLKKADKLLSGVTRAAGNSVGVMDKMTASARNVAAGLGLFKIASKAVDVLSGSLDKAFGRQDTMQNFARSVELMTGNAKAAQKTLDDLNSISRGTAYGLDSMASATRSFITSSYGLEQSTRYVEGWGNAVALYGDGSDETFSRVMYQLGQMAAKGKANLGDLKTAMESGIPVLQLYAEATEQSTEDAAAAISGGKVSAEEFLDTMQYAFEEGTKSFPKATDAAKNAGDSWTATFANARAAVTRGVEGIINATDKLIKNSNIQIFGEQVESIRDVIRITGKTAEKALGYVSEFIDSFAEADTAAEKITMITDALKPAMPLIAFFGGKFTLEKALPSLRAAAQFTDHLRDMAKINAGRAIDKVSGALKGVTKHLKGAGDAIDGFVSGLGPKTAKVLENAPKPFKRFAQKAVSATEAGYLNVLEKTDLLKSGLAGKLEGIPVIGDHLQGAFSKIGAGINKGLTRSFSVGTSVLASMMQAMSGVITTGLKAVAPAAILGVVMAGLGVVYSKFGNQIDQFTALAVEKGPAIVQGLADGIISKLPALITAGAQMIGKLTDVIQANLPAIVTAGIDIIAALVQGVGDNMPLLLNSAGRIIETVLIAIVDGLPRLVIVGLNLLISLTEGIVQALPEIIQSAQLIVDYLAASLTANLPIILQKGIEILQNLVAGVIQLIPVLIPLAAQIVVTLIEGIVTNLPFILQAGVEILVSLVQGIIANLPVIATSGVDIIQALIEGLAVALPQILIAGMTLVVELAGAIIENLPEIAKAGWEIIKALVTGILQAIPQMLGAVWDGITGIFGKLFGKLKGDSADTSASVVSDFEAMTSTMTNSTAAATGNVINSTAELGGAIDKNLSAATSAAEKYGEALQTNYSADIDLTRITSAEHLATLAAATETETSTAASAASENAKTLNKTYTSEMAELAERSGTSVSEMTEKTSSAVGEMTQNIDTELSALISGTDSAMKSLSEAGETGGAQFAEKLGNGLNNALDKANQVADTIADEFEALRGILYNAGNNAGWGFYNGLNSVSGSITSLARSIANSVTTTIQTALQVHSPSRILTWIGKMVGAGMQRGLIFSVRMVQKASDRLAAAAIPDISAPNYDVAGPRESLGLEDMRGVEARRMPAHINLNIGGTNYRAFVENISDQQSAETELELAFA